MRAHEHETGHVTVVAQHITVCENRATPVSITQVDDVTTARKAGVRVQAMAMPVALAQYVRDISVVRCYPMQTDTTNVTKQSDNMTNTQNQHMHNATKTKG